MDATGLDVEAVDLDATEATSDTFVTRDNSLGDMMYCPRFFGFLGTGGTSSSEENDERADGICCMWKKLVGSDAGDEDCVAVLGLCPDMLPLLFAVFPVDGRPAVAAPPVLGREELDDVLVTDGKFGRTPDKDARDCMNRRSNTPFSPTSSPSGPRVEISMVIRGDGGGTPPGMAGTGGGGSDAEWWYLSRRPPVLMRFMSFHHFPPGDISSSLPRVFARDPCPSSCGDALLFGPGLCLAGDGLPIRSATEVSRVIGFRT